VSYNEESIITYAVAVQEAAAVTVAALAGDLDEARFRAQLLVSKTGVAGYDGVARAASQLLVALGPPGGLPSEGYGAHLLRLADELDAIELST
jgi:hypothetical protein